MEQISQQLLYQRLRNRVIELLALHSSLNDVAVLGAFEVVNMVDDSLPLDYKEAPKVFSAKEKETITIFLRLAESAATATLDDKWDVHWFRASTEWSALSKFSQQSLAIFMQRGRFSEETEEALPA